MRSTIVKHLNNHRDAIRSNPAERAKVRAIAETVGDLHCCKLCGWLGIKINHDDICQKCYKQRPKSTLNARTLSDLDRGLAVSSIQNANQTQLRIMADIPSQLRRLWGQCVTSVLDRFAHARTDRESFQALESWTKLKCVLVLPVRGGTKSVTRGCDSTKNKCSSGLQGTQKNAGLTP